MGRLPVRTETLAARLRRFLFGSRVLRWEHGGGDGHRPADVVSTTLMMKQMSYRGAGPASPSGEQAATVRLTFVAPAAKQVAVAGDFNSGGPTAMS